MLKPRNILVLAIIINISLCLLLTFVVYPAMSENLDESYKHAFDEYDVLAQNIVTGNGFKNRHGEESTIRGPGYPLFLAAVYSVAGVKNWTAVQVIQALLSGLVVFMTFILARRLTKSEWTGAAAATMIAFHPILIWYTFRIVLDTQFTLICTVIYFLIDVFIDSPSFKKALGIGALLAFAAYFKSVTLVFPFVFFILLLINKQKIGEAIKWAGITLVTMLILISPWTVRNYMIAEKIIPVHATLAAPIVYGHYEVLTWADDPLSIYEGLEIGHKAMPELVSRMGLGTASIPPESYQEEKLIEQAAISFIKQYYLDNPLDLFTHSALRFLMFWYIRMSKFASIIMIITSVVTITLGVVGWRALKGSKKKWLALGFISLFVLMHSLLIGEARFQHTILPLMMTLAGAGVITILKSRFNLKLEEAD